MAHFMKRGYSPRHQLFSMLRIQANYHTVNIDHFKQLKPQKFIKVFSYFKHLFIFLLPFYIRKIYMLQAIRLRKMNLLKYSINQKMQYQVLSLIQNFL